MVRAAARQLHLTWAEKRHDYCDEMLLQRSGLSMEQIRARRYHLNPPDVNRKYSSILDSRTQVAGLTWARSRLDSDACWSPAAVNGKHWMEMDLGRNYSICGVVTQGHARTKDGMENNYVKSFMVLCRVNGCLDLSEAAVWEDAGQFSSNGGGSERQEHRFDRPRHARYVRIVVLEFENRIALRAGLLLQHPVDNHDTRSPFVLGGPTEQASDTSTLAAGGTSVSQMPGSAPSVASTAGSKAAARAAKQVAVSSDAVSPSAAPCTHPTTENGEASSTAVTIVEPAKSGSKAARWAAKVNGGAKSVAIDQSSMPPATTSQPGQSSVIFDRKAPSPAPPPASVEPVPQHPAPAEEPAGKASRWAARAAARRDLPSAPDPSGFAPDGSSELTYTQVRNKQVHYSGFLMNGLPEQTGEIQWPNGHGYSGEFRAGKPHGKGTHFFPDGSRLDICFEDGCPQGEGVMTEIRQGNLQVAPEDFRTSCECTYYDVKYAASAGIPLKDGAQPSSKDEGNPDTHVTCRMPFVGCSVGAPQAVPVSVDSCARACSCCTLCAGARALRTE
jgi:hypothetical protein